MQNDNVLTTERAFALYMLARTTDSERWINELRNSLATQPEARIVTGDYEVDHGTHVEVRPIYNEPEPRAEVTEEMVEAAAFAYDTFPCPHGESVGRGPHLGQTARNVASRHRRRPHRSLIMKEPILSREEAFKLARCFEGTENVDNIPAVVALTPLELEQFVSAVLEKLCGEPVAWEFSSPVGEKPSLAFLTSKSDTLEHYRNQGWRVLPLYTLKGRQS